jgi:sterol 3beta-glucosyltransferase
VSYEILVRIFNQKTMDNQLKIKTITFLTTGTRGDTQPYVALGVELKKRGYNVRIAAFENYENFVKSHGLDYAKINGDVTKAVNSEMGREAMKADNPLKFMMSFSKMQQLVFELQKDFYAACEGSDAIVYHPGAAIGYFVGKKLGIPTILATPFPMTPTREYPSIIFYDKIRWGRFANYLTHKITQKIMWFASSSPIKKLWKEKFNSLPDNFSNPFERQNTRQNPTIISCSNYVFPQPKDWSSNIYNTGYWFLEEENWQPSAELTAFLNNGKPPIYVGFGSVGDSKQAEETTKIVLNALKKAGERGILATGWAGKQLDIQASDDVFILDSVPHSWLFPKMKAVVHHGGAGTTASGLCAGVPNIVIPHGNDQFGWGLRVFELGVGSKPIPRKKLTADNLAEAIRFINDPNIQQNAKALGLKIQSEEGTKNAVGIIIKSMF